MNAEEWKYWQNMHVVKVWQACSLAFDLNPEWTVDECRLTDSEEDAYNKFSTQLKSNLTKRKHFSEPISEDTVRLDEFAAWCLHIGQVIPQELAALANKEQVETNSNQLAQVTSGRNQQIIPPGKMPRTTIGKLVIKAAWEIECCSGKHATVSQIISKLHEWESNEPEIVENIPHGVKWQTKKGIVKSFGVDACAKALETWHASRG